MQGKLGPTKIPLSVDDKRMNPKESHLAHRFKSTALSEVGSAMIGTYMAADKIVCFSDKEKGTFL